MASVEIMRRDCSVSQLRAEAARTVDAKQARRILAIAMVLDGHARLLAAQACGMDRQTLRDWVISLQRGWGGRAGRPATAWTPGRSIGRATGRGGAVGSKRP